MACRLMRANCFASLASTLQGVSCTNLSTHSVLMQKWGVLICQRLRLSSMMRYYGNEEKLKKSVARAVLQSVARQPSWLRGRQLQLGATISARKFSGSAVHRAQEGKAGCEPDGHPDSQSATPVGENGPALSECASAGAAIRWWSMAFSQRGVPEAEVSAEYLVAHALGYKQLSDLTNRVLENHLSQCQLNLINKLCARRSERVPVQYIVGDWDFRDETFTLRPPVFIPRPETEMLVDVILAHYQEGSRHHFLEVGCGSGVISISLLKELPELRMTAIDASEEALQLTTENAKRLGVLDRLTLHHAALASSLPQCLQGRRPPFDAVVSNPPYLPTEAMEKLAPEIKLYEDPGAVHAGPDGLDVIKHLVQNANQLVVPGGSIWLETDIHHPGDLRTWLAGNPQLGVRYVRSFLDYTDRTRFSQLEFHP